MIQRVTKMSRASYSCLSSLSIRQLSSTSKGQSIFKDREHAIEDMYFSKQEKDLLKNLVNKMEKQEKSLEVAHPVLSKIFAHHKVPLSDVR